MYSFFKKQNKLHEEVEQLQPVSIFARTLWLVYTLSTKDNFCYYSVSFSGFHL